MIAKEQYEEITDVFPELAHDFVYLTKEVYAFFGLLFYNFAIVEHSLINILSIKIAREKCGDDDSQDLVELIERAYQSVRRKTFGRLRTEVLEIAEFIKWKEELDAAKKQRDYFVHHFCREEFGFPLTDEARWHILWELHKVRKSLRRLEKALRYSMKEMCTRIGVGMPNIDELNTFSEKRASERNADIISGLFDFGWNKSLD